MPYIFTYLLKVSLSLGVVFLFYQLVLRRLTFYNWNRWYLLGYSLLAFFIPFIDISIVLEQQEWSNNQFIQWVPVLNNQPLNHTPGVDASETGSLSLWEFAGIVFAIGAIFMLVRLLVQLFSFRKMMKRSELILEDDMKVYQVNESIIPFSFGNSIFINRNLHTKEELQEIIRHEFVHARQRHTIDIIWGELLCLINWYNPFAWLLKRSIRQNLEFVADNKVLENGVDKKQYQYLLLKVIGNSQFSIANQFNFSSLKKRIAMMNKIKTARVHAIRFLFVLPLLFVLLVAFRDRYMNNDSKPVIRTDVIVVDKDTRQPLQGVKVVNLNTGKQATTNEDGYYSMEVPADKPIHVTMQYSLKGYVMLETHPFSLEKKDNKESINLKEVVAIWKESNTGDCVGCGSSVHVEDAGKAESGVGYAAVKNYSERLNEFFIDTVPAVRTVNSKGYYVDIIGVNGNCTVVVKDKNKKEVARLLLTDWNAKEDYYENMYGEILPPPPPIPPIPPVAPVALAEKAPSEPPVAPVAPIAPVAPVPDCDDAITGIGRNFEITDKKAVIYLKDGTKDEFDLTNKAEVARFEKKYGKIIRTGGTGGISPVAVIAGGSGQTVIAPMAPLPEMTGFGGNSLVVDPEGAIITGKEDVLVTITRNTTREQLEDYKKQMKAKGVDLTYDEIEYNEKGKLVSISGHMKSNMGNSNFVASDFSTLVLAVVKSGDRNYFKVHTTNNKVTI
jgi:beta-lactamase regulating signal transducer with metallopeptidase domain